MLFLMGVLALLLASPNANADDKEKYKLFAEETRKEVWALELPEFANTAVPESTRTSLPSFWLHTAGWKSLKRPAST